MKKILCLISLVGSLTPILNISPLSYNLSKNRISNKISEINSIQSIVKIRLNSNFNWIEPEERNFCLPTDIAMILNYFGITGISQFDIQNEIQSNLSNVAPYLNNHLHNRLQPNGYYRTYIPNNFGISNSELIMIEQYVTQSIGRNVPIVFGYFEDSASTGHAVTITGVDIDTENQQNSRFYIADPNNQNRTFIFGRDMRALLRFGGSFIGSPNNFDFNKRKISVSPLTADQNLYSYSNKKVGTINTDLTSIGINSIKDFKNEFKSIELPSFRGSVALFSQTVFTNTFNLNTLDYPETYYDWLSGNYEIINKIEDSGAAHIEGRILTQVNFTHIHGHLIFSLILLIGGTSWATQNWAHVWLNSGNLLTFIRK